MIYFCNMVGKGCEPTNSRIFQQCYLKCCKLQNVTPLHCVLPNGNGKILDFCVDRIKYADWPPILNALSCDLSLHSVCLKCRQSVKTVLEHIDCERLAKTVNNRCVMLTNFMLSNLMEAISQLLSKSTLLTTLTLEGLPLKIPYLNPLCEALSMNNSLQHLHLPRCMIGDAGCLAICKCIRGLPNLLTLELSHCELTSLGAGYLADLVKYQKINRYSENWIHTLRYRLPDLDTMGGLRRITLCANPELGDDGVAKLLEVLADDLWIKALDIQNCGITEATADSVLNVMTSNTTLVVLDMRNNPQVSKESLAKVRAALRDNDRGTAGPFSWLASVSSSAGSSDRLHKSAIVKNGVAKERMPNPRNVNPNFKTTTANANKKDKEYSDMLLELQEEISHRQQLEELNQQLVEQMKEMKQQQFRLWANRPDSSNSEPSLQASSRSGDMSSSSGSTTSVPIDQSTLSYIQQAFKDIYSFIKNNQCYGECRHKTCLEDDKNNMIESPLGSQERTEAAHEFIDMASHENRGNMIPKKAQSTHQKMVNVTRFNKTTKSAHLLGDNQLKSTLRTKPGMIERQMGDTKMAYNDNLVALEDRLSPTHAKLKKISPSSSVSSATLVCSPPPPRRTVDINPQEALYSSSESEGDSS